MTIIASTWSFSARGNDAAWPLLEAGRALDAVEESCRVIELAPDVDSVGYGGLPDASGRVSLDGCVMLAPARCGSVCGLRRHLHPVSVARLVMERTPHIMLAGPDADEFAERHGLAPAGLLEPGAEAAWKRWLADPGPVDQSRDRLDGGVRPLDSGLSGSGRLFSRDDHLPSDEARWRHHDTIGTLCIDSAGTMAGACSTSGTPFKVPGRVGDSPIIGHGLYCDPLVGAATATGAGELVMGVCGSFLAVESMRRGRSPLDAAVEVLERIRSSFELRPHHQVAILVMSPQGRWGAAALRPGFRIAVRDRDGARLHEPGITLLVDPAKPARP